MWRNVLESERWGRGAKEKTPATSLCELLLKLPLNAMWFINAENNQKHLKIPNWTSENGVNEGSFSQLRSIFQLSYFLVMMPIIDKDFFDVVSVHVYAAFHFPFALLIPTLSQLCVYLRRNSPRPRKRKLGIGKKILFRNWFLLKDKYVFCQKLITSNSYNKYKSSVK